MDDTLLKSIMINLNSGQDELKTAFLYLTRHYPSVEDSYWTGLL